MTLVDMVFVWALNPLCPTLTHITQHNSWVCACLGPPYNPTIIVVYAPTSTSERCKVWEEIKQFFGPVVFTGDFNMVTSLDDRWNHLGKCISGHEGNIWMDLSDHIDLQDDSSFEMTWANNQTGANYSQPALIDFLLLQGC